VRTWQLGFGFDAAVALFLVGAGVPASAEHHCGVHGGGARGGAYHSQRNSRRCAYAAAKGGPLGGSALACFPFPVCQ